MGEDLSRVVEHGHLVSDSRMSLTNVTIVGINSDIGFEMAYRFISRDCRVQGTYRNHKPDSFLISEGSPFPNSASPHFVEVDLTNQNHMYDAPKKMEGWDLLLCCAGTMEPIGKFMDCDPFLWDYAVRVNALGPLRLLRYLWPLRRPEASVCFLAGPNLSKRTPTYSAYKAGKSMLTEMVRELAHEEPDHRIFLLAPGVVQTKIHQQTIRAGEKAANLERVKGIIEGNEKTTPFDAIFECLNWCISEPMDQITGRTVHVDHDPWRGGHLRVA